MALRLNLSTDQFERLKSLLSLYFPTRKNEFEHCASKLGCRVSLDPIRTKRSTEQNARYWKIVGALGEFSGMDKEEMHREILCEYHGYEMVENKITGYAIKKPLGRSHNLKKDDFSDLMFIAERWAAEAGVHWEE